MYYIDTPYCFNGSNAKCKAIHKHVRKYSSSLVYDDETRDAIVKKIKEFVEQANQDYPRTKTLEVQFYRDGLSVVPVPRMSDSDAVVSIHFLPVGRLWQLKGVNLTKEDWK